jgi:hypothetical protein
LGRREFRQELLAQVRQMATPKDGGGEVRQSALLIVYVWGRPRTSLPCCSVTTRKGQVKKLCSAPHMQTMACTKSITLKPALAINRKERKERIERNL